MPVVNTHLFTHHSPGNLYSLVSDVARYPEFIKWIKAMRISGERSEGYIHHRLAEVVVGFKGFTESFATDVSSNPVGRTVNVNLVRGPFKRLQNIWNFYAQDDGTTKVDFHIDYSFSNPVLAMLARSNTDTAINRIIESFLAEADRRFGTLTTEV